MCNPFARLAKRDAPRPSLRERLTATKARAKMAFAVSRVIAKGPPATVPAVDRIALVNYASWLHMERRLVCAELYPHRGTDADKFVLSCNAAERFHFPHSDRYPGRSTLSASAASRAVDVLDMVGVAWREDLNERDHLDPVSAQDNGKRPDVPYGWPALDGVLVTACGDLQRLDAATRVLLKDDPRDAFDVPGFQGLDEERGAVLSVLVRERAESLAGLKAKAKAMLTMEDYEGIADFARSIAADLLNAKRGILTPVADPILPMIEEGCRRLREVEAAFAASADADDNDPRFVARNALLGEMWAHVDGTILKTVPHTAAGCRELARFAVEFFKSQGVPISDDEQAVTNLIAQSALI
ncbi:hypothetical protein MKK58_04435 [Methylobacterium sp. J-078]|uniref:hypothetical protein n=1 Tax=Methylobacterium sp. J-078 TaxID=2836657 RepID=UPI001FBB3CA2|nr:hypothetical protein [Methylobacterium sp. J-078]MCJ2043785.1 hypothetical protein [Methylobacterium sp. J-078]